MIQRSLLRGCAIAERGSRKQNSSGVITLFVSFIMFKQVVIFVYNRSKISDLFILQFVYFASCKHFFIIFSSTYSIS